MAGKLLHVVEIQAYVRGEVDRSPEIGNRVTNAPHAGAAALHCRANAVTPAVFALEAVVHYWCRSLLDDLQFTTTENQSL